MSFCEWRSPSSFQRVSARERPSAWPWPPPPASPWPKERIKPPSLRGNLAIGQSGNLELLIAELPSRLIASSWCSCPARSLLLQSQLLEDPPVVEPVPEKLPGGRSCCHIGDEAPQEKVRGDLVLTASASWT